MKEIELSWRGVDKLVACVLDGVDRSEILPYVSSQYPNSTWRFAGFGDNVEFITRRCPDHKGRMDYTILGKYQSKFLPNEPVVEAPVTATSIVTDAIKEDGLRKSMIELALLPAKRDIEYLLNESSGNIPYGMTAAFMKQHPDDKRAKFVTAVRDISELGYNDRIPLSSATEFEQGKRVLLFTHEQMDMMRMLIGILGGVMISVESTAKPF